MIDISGQKFERLTAVEPCRKNGKRMWRCVCSCGGETVTPVTALLRGHTRSCGCLFKEIRNRGANRRHGHTNAPEYCIWHAMRNRCARPSVERYPIYGGRGITVCERWQKFENFYADMGPRPSSRHSIDRIDGDGNYEPGNCRWATVTEQSNNRSHVKLVSDGERTLCLAQWIREIAISYPTLRRRLAEGLTINEIRARYGAREGTPTWH